MRAPVWICLLLATGCATASPKAELAEAKALFERNIEAIQNKDKEAYLQCYRQDDRLVRAGPEGVKLGFAPFAEETPKTGSDQWPESLEASQMEVQWLSPGLIYGTYRYRVVIEGKETVGLSERVFIKQNGRWVITVSTAFADP